MTSNTSFLQSEVLQAPGHYLDIYIRIFNFLYMQLSTGNTVG